MAKNDDIIKKALEYYGLNEIYGGNVNPKVLKFLDDITGDVNTKNIPWCAAFVGSILKSCSRKYSELLTARSYLKVGTAVKNPEVGDIVVFHRGNPDHWTGHVGFFISESNKVIYVLGGNQNNQVCIKPYPKANLLGYRRPVKSKPMVVK